ncbi:MAG TPA: hypothetical protein VGF45_01365 [Polyangia bacterium]
MSELLELFAIFAVIYLLDCGVVVPRRTFGLVRFVGQWRLQRAFSPNAAWSQGALFGNPLPPLSPPLIVEPLPVVLGPEGVSIDAVEQSEAFVEWAELGQISVSGTRLELAGRGVVTFASRRAAVTVAEAITRLATMSPPARIKFLERLVATRFDHQVVSDRIKQFARETRLLAVLANLLWIALFGTLLALVRFPVAAVLLAGVLVVLIAWMAVPVVTERVLRKSAWLRRDWWPRRSQRVLAALTPMGAIRSRDLLARELFGDLDPLAVCTQLLPTETLATAARTRLIALNFRTRVEEGPASINRSWWKEQALDHMNRLLRSRGIEAASLIAAPPRESAAAVAYCPSCRAQFSEPPARGCTDPGCAGIVLVPYDAVEPSASRRKDHS